MPAETVSIETNPAEGSVDTAIEHAETVVMEQIKTYAEAESALLGAAPEAGTSEETMSVTSATVETVTEAEPTVLDNALTIGIVAAMAVAVIVMVIRKAISNKKAANAPVEEVAEAPAVELPTAPGTAGDVKLHNVDPKTAAMLMAIVADKMGKPINELRFISVKEVE